jgi:hypothetical protein
MTSSLMVNVSVGEVFDVPKRSVQKQSTCAHSQMLSISSHQVLEIILETVRNVPDVDVFAVRRLMTNMVSTSMSA